MLNTENKLAIKIKGFKDVLFNTICNHVYHFIASRFHKLIKEKCCKSSCPLIINKKKTYYRVLSIVCRRWFVISSQIHHRAPVSSALRQWKDFFHRYSDRFRLLRLNEEDTEFRHVYRKPPIFCFRQLSLWSSCLWLASSQAHR